MSMTQWEQAQIAGKLREELGSLTLRYGGGGLVYNILFYKEGYHIHGVDHVTDPKDNREKLVMFDPHHYKALIFNPQTQMIEWEYDVPGTDVNAPNQGACYWKTWRTSEMPAMSTAWTGTRTSSWSTGKRRA